MGQEHLVLVSADGLDTVSAESLLASALYLGRTGCVLRLLLPHLHAGVLRWEKWVTSF